MYIVNVALRYARRLEPLGRFVWQRGVSREIRADDRRDVADLCVAMLQEAGRPLTTRELEKRVERVRTVHHHFQPHPTKNMARLGAGLWGLVERDFGLSETSRHQVLDSLFVCLEARGTALHVSEITGVLRTVLGPRRKIGKAHAIMGLAQTDERFRVTRGQSIALAKWTSESVG